MKTYSSLQKPIAFMFYWLNYCDENNHTERIPVVVKNIDQFFNLATEIIEADRFHLLLLSDGTRINDNDRINCLCEGTSPEIVGLF